MSLESVFERLRFRFAIWVRYRCGHFKVHMVYFILYFAILFHFCFNFIYNGQILDY